LDGVARQRLDAKCSGVFEHAVDPHHALTTHLTPPAPAPHSRLNELTRQDLSGAGYDVLTWSQEAGVNLFAKQLQSQFVFWQGHPEYDARSLLKEYQRDVGRYLRAERDTYPSMPRGTFDSETQRQLQLFEQQARAERREELLKAFPYERAAARLRWSWREGATQVYRQWLLGIAANVSM
jgi:homoserine O-succinyltransferase